MIGDVLISIIVIWCGDVVFCVVELLFIAMTKKKQKKNNIIKWIEINW